MTETITREEFLQLIRRVDHIDDSGTRGVAVLAVQMQEIAKDFAKHEEKHDRQEAARASNRKWLFTAAVMVIAAIDGPIVTIVLASRGH